MSESTEMITSSVYFCQECGECVDINVRPCPNCGAERAEQTADDFRLNVVLDVIKCDSCGTCSSIGSELCRGCGIAIDSESDGVPSASRLGQAKNALFGKDVALVSELAQGLPNYVSQDNLITSEQFLSFVNRSNLISVEPIGLLKDQLRVVDLGSKKAIKSHRSKTAFKIITEEAQRIASVCSELNKFSVDDQLHRFHLLISAMYRQYLDLYLAAMKGLLSSTIEDASESQRQLTSAIGLLSETAKLMSQLTELIDGTELNGDEIRRRLTLFIGKMRSYEFQKLPDLAMALSTAIGERRFIEASPELEAKARGYFSKLSNLRLGRIPDYLGITLFHLALATSASFDPLPAMRRTDGILGLYADALDKSAEEFGSAFVESRSETMQALSSLISLGDRILHTDLSRMSLDARRYEMVSVYTGLVESSYSKLIGLPVSAKHIIDGEAISFTEISSMTFGERHNLLSQVQSPKYAPVLFGIDTVARNGGSHGGIDTSGERIVLKSIDRHKVEKCSDYSDDEFLDLILNLVVTCQSLALANSLFELMHFNVTDFEQATLHRNIAATAVRSLVGLFGLVNPTVNADDFDLVTISAIEDPSRPMGRYQDHMLALLSAMTLFPKHKSVRLRVGDNAGRSTTLELSAGVVETHQSLSEQLQAYSIVYVCALLNQQLPRTVQFEEGFSMRTLGKMLIVLLSEFLAEYQKEYPQWPALRSQANQMTTAISWVIECLDKFPLEPKDIDPQRFRSALMAARKGLNQVASEKRSIGRAKPNLLLVIASSELVNAVKDGTA